MYIMECGAFIDLRVLCIGRHNIQNLLHNATSTRARPFLVRHYPYIYRSFHTYFIVRTQENRIRWSGHVLPMLLSLCMYVSLCWRPWKKYIICVCMALGHRQSSLYGSSSQIIRTIILHTITNILLYICINGRLKYI